MAILAFDAKRAFCNSSGLGVYSRTLLKSLIKSHPEHQFHLYSPANKHKFPEAGDLPHTFHSAPTGTPGALWRSYLCTREIRKSKANIYHGLSNELPMGSMKGVAQIITIHDLIFLTHPQLYPATDRYFYRKKFASGVKKADEVIAISQTTAKAIKETGLVDPAKITVIIQGCDEAFFSGLSFPRPEWAPTEYLLFVGNVEKRKDLMTLLKAIENIDFPLVIAGGHTPYVKTLEQFIRDKKLDKRVLLPGKVSTEDLHALYQNSKGVVYPSFIEGWGLPVAEALCYGKPVITTKGTSMEEIASGAGLFFSAGDHEQLEFQINQLVTDPDLEQKLSKSAQLKKEEFNPFTAAANYMNIYEKYF